MHDSPLQPHANAVEYADIPLIDLSAAFTKDGRADAEVTKHLVDAMHKVGFCYVVNHGYSPEQVWALISITSILRFLRRFHCDLRARFER